MSKLGEREPLESANQRFDGCIGIPRLVEMRLKSFVVHQIHRKTSECGGPSRGGDRISNGGGACGRLQELLHAIAIFKRRSRQ